VTISQAIRAAAERLALTSDTARLDAELLMAHTLGVSRSDMLLWHMNDLEPARFEHRVDRRAAHEPVAYITGVCEFYGREFRVNSDVLIPRPDSETIVEAALEALNEVPTGHLNLPDILDLGTGSGALLLSVLAERSDLTGYGIDCSEGALRMARDNAERLGLCDRATFEEADWTKRSGRGDDWAAALVPAALILANPPYVENDAQIGSNVREFEPAGALFAGPEGLDDYRLIIPSLRNLLLDGGKAVLEIGHTQAEAVTELAEKAGFAVDVRHDLANRPRALVLSSGNW